MVSVVLVGFFFSSIVVLLCCCFCYVTLETQRSSTDFYWLRMDCAFHPIHSFSLWINKNRRRWHFLVQNGSISISNDPGKEYQVAAWPVCHCLIHQGVAVSVRRFGLLVSSALDVHHNCEWISQALSPSTNHVAPVSHSNLLYPHHTVLRNTKTPTNNHKNKRIIQIKINYRP